MVRMVEAYEDFLKVEGWNSAHKSVQKLLSHLNRKSKSESSRKSYLKTLANFCKFTGLQPDGLVALSREEVESRIQEFCDQANAPRTANRKAEELKTFFASNGFKAGGRSSLTVEKRYVAARDRARPEYIPTVEEIRRISDSSGLSLKWRALFLAAYTTGLRNSTLRALRYGDIKEELEAGITPLLVNVYPGMKEVVPEACKGRITYFVFMHKETIEALKAYLADRERRLAPLEKDQILFCSDDKQIAKEERPYKPLDTTSPERTLKDAAKVAGIPNPERVVPHSLRKAFERALRNSGLDPKDQEFFMGHILPGSQDTYYDKTKIEEMRAKYGRVQFFPGRAVSEDRLREAFKKQLLLVAGFSEEEMIKMDLGSVSDEELRAKVRERLLGVMANNGAKQRVIPVGEVEDYIAKGWEFVTTIPNDKAILKLPS